MSRIPLRATLGAFLLCAASASAAPAGAQLASDAPRMLGPHAPAGFGMYWLRASAYGAGDGLLMTWAPGKLAGKVFLRGGAATGLEGTPAGFAGVDLRVPIGTRRPGRLLDFSWSAGLGASFGEYLMGTLPMGIAAGHEWSSGAVSFAPHLSAGLALDMRFFQDERDRQEEFTVQPSAELGVDLSLDTGRKVTLRTGVSLWERRAVAVGVMLQGR